MKRIKREMDTVAAMIEYYCKKHHSSDQLCPECKELLDYSHHRLEKCKFGNEKPTCKACPVHCYAPEKRQKIREVMAFSGPGMILRHPVLSIYHLLIDSR